MAEYYPIVYIRRYAMTPSEVEDTFNKPYYGFNLGSTQLRQGRDERPTMQIFESPVVRLIKEDGYVDSFNRYVDASNQPIPGSVPGNAWRKTLWIFRYYDKEAKLFGETRGEIEDYATALARFLDGVRRACGSPDGFKVNLVAHSMGGLVARCYLQNEKIFDNSDPALQSPVEVNKLFTYGTPHRGITFRRGLPAYIQTRHEETQSGIVVPMRRKANGKGYEQEDPQPVHLFTGFLRLDKKLKGDGFSRGAFQIKIEPHYVHDGWIRDSRFEGEAMFHNRFHVGVRPSEKEAEVQYHWGPFAGNEGKKPEPDGSYLFPLPQAGRRYLAGKGLRIKVTPWS